MVFVPVLAQFSMLFLKSREICGSMKMVRIRVFHRKLMHDFRCTDASDMNFVLLAGRTRYLKENPKG